MQRTGGAEAEWKKSAPRGFIGLGLSKSNVTMVQTPVKAPSVSVRFAGTRTTGLSRGPMWYLVGWKIESGQLGPDGYGRCEGPRWRCP